jgi:hypothetical protein
MDASVRPIPCKLPHPTTFAHLMRTHWGRLGNVSSPALVRLWETMGETFNAAIEANTADWSDQNPETFDFR